MKMIKYTIIILLAFLISSCNFSKQEQEKNSSFYSTIAGWDIKHIPIIPPFRASSTYPGQWLIGGSKELLHLGKNRAGDIPVTEFGVSKNFVYGKTENNQWFLFNIQSLLYTEYETENELDTTLKIFKLTKNKIESCEKYFKQLSISKNCYWFPKTGNTYPQFEDLPPKDIYTIKVIGADKVTDFVLKEEIISSPTKIYNFRIQYDSKLANDLYYVSFDHSPPKLINDSLIYTGTSDNKNSLNISVYTPFPVGQRKGIDEKDRVVISKNTKLN